MENVETRNKYRKSRPCCMTELLDKRDFSSALINIFLKSQQNNFFL